MTQSLHDVKDGKLFNSWGVSARNFRRCFKIHTKISELKYLPDAHNLLSVMRIPIRNLAIRRWQA